jgi:hypothetical protein
MSTLEAARSAKPASAKQDRWLSPEHVCEKYPGLTLWVLAERRKRRVKPDYFKPTGESGAGTVLYLESEVEAWILGGRVKTREAS